MTQVFDPEDGHVERVTVVEAGPCWVTAIRRADRDGYDAVQLGFGEVREKRLTKGQLGHLAKADAPPLRRLAEFRDEAGELQVGDQLKVGDVFEKGQTVKVSGVSKGKGFQGTIKRHNFSPRARVATARTTCARRDRSARRPRPSRVFKGIRGPGQMGNKRVTQRGLEVVDVRPEENLLLLRGSVPGPKGVIVEIRSGRLMAAPQAPYIGKKTGKVDARRGRLRRVLPRAARAPRAWWPS